MPYTFTAYESDGTAHELESRTEWGRECRETSDEGMAIWYRDMGDGRYTGYDRETTLWGQAWCLYCDRPLQFAAEYPPDVPSVDDDTAWAEIARHHAHTCEWVITRAHWLDNV